MGLSLRPRGAWRSSGLSAWESVQSGSSIWPDLRNGLSVSDRESPRFTRVNGPLMARRLDHVDGRPSAFQAGHIPSWRRSCECCALSPVAAVSRRSAAVAVIVAVSAGCQRSRSGTIYAAAAATGAWRCARQLRSSASSMALRSYWLRPRESSQSTRSPVMPFSACTACRAHPRADSPSRSITVTRAYLPHGPSSAIVSKQRNRLASMILF